ncbi:RHS domain-containing protein [Pleionea sp. CnH1-48]|nr:RHS domain-containing protein [Pleionea sp. CnH1-48]
MLEYDDIYYYHNSHIGTPEILTDSQQFVVWQADYDLWGSATILVGDVENNLRFTGQYFDSETSLHYNWNRYYDPMLGRYITSDPIGLAGGINTYLYVSNSPFSLVDPTGELGVKGALLGVTASIGLQLFKNAGRWWCIDLVEVALFGAIGFFAPSKLKFLGNARKSGKQVKKLKEEINKGKTITTQKTKGGSTIIRSSKKIIDKHMSDRGGEILLIGAGMVLKEVYKDQDKFTYRIEDVFNSSFFRKFIPFEAYKFFKDKCDNKECV